MRNSLQKYYFYLYKRVVFACFFERKLHFFPSRLGDGKDTSYKQRGVMIFCLFIILFNV